MAVLSDADRREAWAEFMRETSRGVSPFNLSKINLRAAVDAIDDWVDTNAAAFNTAIPQPARDVLTTKQKAQLLALVVSRRFTAAV